MKNAYQTVVAILGPIFLLGGIVAMAYVCWQLERYVHYRGSYEAMVKQTVREMVRKEALR